MASAPTKLSVREFVKSILKDEHFIFLPEKNFDAYYIKLMNFGEGSDASFSKEMEFFEEKMASLYKVGESYKAEDINMLSLLSYSEMCVVSSVGSETRKTKIPAKCISTTCGYNPFSILNFAGKISKIMFLATSTTGSIKYEDEKTDAAEFEVRKEYRLQWFPSDYFHKVIDKVTEGMATETFHEAVALYVKRLKKPNLLFMDFELVQFILEAKKLSEFSKNEEISKKNIIKTTTDMLTAAAGKLDDMHLNFVNRRKRKPSIFSEEKFNACRKYLLYSLLNDKKLTSSLGIMETMVALLNFSKEETFLSKEYIERISVGNGPKPDRLFKLIALCKNGADVGCFSMMEKIERTMGWLENMYYSVIDTHYFGKKFEVIQIDDVSNMMRDECLYPVSLYRMFDAAKLLLNETVALLARTDVLYLVRNTKVVRGNLVVFVTDPAYERKEKSKTKEGEEVVEDEEKDPFNLNGNGEAFPKLIDIGMVKLTVDERVQKSLREILRAINKGLWISYLIYMQACSYLPFLNDCFDESGIVNLISIFESGGKDNRYILKKLTNDILLTNEIVKTSMVEIKNKMNEHDLMFRLFRAENEIARGELTKKGKKLQKRRQHHTTIKSYSDLDPEWLLKFTGAKMISSDQHFVVGDVSVFHDNIPVYPHFLSLTEDLIQDVLNENIRGISKDVFKTITAQKRSAVPEQGASEDRLTTTEKGNLKTYSPFMMDLGKNLKHELYKESDEISKSKEIVKDKRRRRIEVKETTAFPEALANEISTVASVKNPHVGVLIISDKGEKDKEWLPSKRIIGQYEGSVVKLDEVNFSYKLYPDGLPNYDVDANGSRQIALKKTIVGVGYYRGACGVCLRRYRCTFIGGTPETFSTFFADITSSVERIYKEAICVPTTIVIDAIHPSDINAKTAVDGDKTPLTESDIVKLRKKFFFRTNWVSYTNDGRRFFEDGTNYYTKPADFQWNDAGTLIQTSVIDIEPNNVDEGIDILDELSVNYGEDYQFPWEKK